MLLQWSGFLTMPETGSHIACVCVCVENEACSFPAFDKGCLEQQLPGTGNMLSDWEHDVQYIRIIK